MRARVIARFEHFAGAAEAHAPAEFAFEQFCRAAIIRNGQRCAGRGVQPEANFFFAQEELNAFDGAVMAAIQCQCNTQNREQCAKFFAAAGAQRGIEFVIGIGIRISLITNQAGDERASRIGKTVNSGVAGNVFSVFVIAAGADGASGVVQNGGDFQGQAEVIGKLMDWRQLIE